MYGCLLRGRLHGKDNHIFIIELIFITVERQVSKMEEVTLGLATLTGRHPAERGWRQPGCTAPRMSHKDSKYTEVGIHDDI
jgi:hypothetical protein